MKKQINLAIAIAVVAFAACKKASNGADGKNGTTIISGKGMPKSIEGSEGDFYMDTIDRVLWGPKTGKNWGNGIEMKTNSFLSGTVNPIGSLGVDGDFYLNTSSKMLFGPKTLGSWGPGTSLILNGYTSNVIYTTWMNASSTVKDSTNDGTAIKVVHLYPSSLSQDILSNGLMLAYMRISGETTNYALPYTSNAGSKANTLNALFGFKHVVITRYTHDNSGSVGIASSLQYKFIFIPGNLAGSAFPSFGNQKSNEKNYFVQLPGMEQPADLRSMSFEEVCKLLNINSKL